MYATIARRRAGHHGQCFAAVARWSWRRLVRHRSRSLDLSPKGGSAPAAATTGVDAAPCSCIPDRAVDRGEAPTMQFRKRIVSYSNLIYEKPPLRYT
jgi:hypothetical protein